MELIKELHETDVGVRTVRGKEIRYSLRKTARAVLFDAQGKVALLWLSKDHYHKLPGGGIEKGESVAEALTREILEETGWEIAPEPKEIGAIIEYRNWYQCLQISYCFKAWVVGTPKPVSFTARERSQGFQLKWLGLEEAIETVKKEVPRSYSGKFIQKRDLAFLERAKKISRPSSVAQDVVLEQGQEYRF